MQDARVELNQPDNAAENNINDIDDRLNQEQIDRKIRLLFPPNSSLYNHSP